MPSAGCPKPCQVPESSADHIGHSLHTGFAERRYWPDYLIIDRHHFQCDNRNTRQYPQRRPVQTDRRFPCERYRGIAEHGVFRRFQQTVRHRRERQGSAGGYRPSYRPERAAADLDRGSDRHHQAEPGTKSVAAYRDAYKMQQETNSNYLQMAMAQAATTEVTTAGTTTGAVSTRHR